MNAQPTTVVIGASKGPGLLILQALAEAGHQVTGIARTRPECALPDNASFKTMDATDSQTLAETIPAGAALVHASRPEFLTCYLETRPELSRLIAIGSTRIYTRFPDDKCRRVTNMVEAIIKADVSATILHPTMIYGAPGLNNIERIVRYARFLPAIPLPDNGKALIQPVHANDVTKAVMACLNDNTTIGKTYLVPGASAVSYRAFIELCIHTAGTRCRVISLPLPLLRAAAVITPVLPFLPTITQEEIQRLTENKDFDTSNLTNQLGITPLTLEEGLPLAIS